MKQETNVAKESNKAKEILDNETPVIRNYKDSIFRMIFRDKRALLNLYNALNETDYQEPDELEVNTLENAIYLGRKNDISFVVYGDLNLYEHQSTFNANMPLRNLLYIASLYSKMAAGFNTYSSKLEKIPRPHFVTFYNGKEYQPERQILKLSDAYEVQRKSRTGEAPELELRVLVININNGYNPQLLDNCRELCEYMIYVNRVRHYALTMDLSDAVEQAVKECIEEGVLAEFLRKNRAEVVSMSIFEYNQEEHFRMIEKESREDGIAIGKAEGKAEDILDLLSELGTISEGLSSTIRAEKNLEVLKGWLKLAARADSIAEFEHQMQGKCKG